MQPVSRRARPSTLPLLCGLLFTCFAGVTGRQLGAQSQAPDSLPLTGLRLELQRSDAQQSALQSLLQAQRTPGNASYHQWLTPEQFAQRFAPDTATQEAAIAWLQSQGLTDAKLSRNGMRVTFSGTVSQVQHAFAVKLQTAADAATGATLLPNTVKSVHGLSAFRTLGGVTQDADAQAIAALAQLVESNQAASVVTTPVAGASSLAADRLELLAEAAAQGITVLQIAGTSADTADASVAVLLSSAAANPTAGIAGRPAWQQAAGLPDDATRAVPDAVVDANALVQALNSFAAQHGRVGPLAPQLYALASGHGVFTHEQTGTGEGNWTATDGLGTLSIPALVRALATGTTAGNLALAASATTLTHGQAITLTFTATGGSGTPSGSVTATLKGRSTSTVTLGPATLGANGTATLSTNTLDGDIYDISGAYSGDGTYAANTSNTVTSTVNPETVTLTASAPSAALGSNIPVTVTAKAASGVGAPAGTVTVTQYGTTTTTSSGTLASGSAGTSTTVVNIPATTAGTSISFQASCASTSGSFACSQPATFTAAVTAATPTVTLTVAPEATVANSATQKYDLTVNVAAPSSSSSLPAATGSVAIQDGGVTVTTVTLSKGAATYVLSLSGTGHSLTAVYGGDANYAAATSAAVAVDAPKISTTTTLAASPTSISFGSTSSLTATVTPGSYAAAGAPTGTVTFRDTLQGVVGTATLANGFVTYSASALTVGTHSVTAVYAGDSNYAASTSSAVTITVAQGKVSTTTTLAIAPAQPLAGQLTTLSASVAPSTATGLTIVCTGQVTFFSNNVFLANGTLSGGSVSVSTRLSLGNNSVTAVYGGDTQCYGSTSTAQVVSPARIASTLSLQSSVSYANAGQTIQLTATATPTDSTLTGTPTGTVTFYALRGGVQTVLGTAVLAATGLNSSIAILNVDGSSAGSQSFSATYAGDTVFLPSSSATIVVNFGDFGVTFNPASLTITRGNSGTALATLTVNYGFTGAVVLTCLPPGNSLITCSFNPATLTGGGTSVLTVKTTTTSASLRRPETNRVFVAAFGIAGLLLLPLLRQRRWMGALILLACCVLAGGGCSLSTVDSTNNINSGGSSPTSGGGGTTTTGTPLGTQILTITATSGDGTLRHTYSFPVTVQ